MGNSSSSNKRSLATHELERYTRPTGLYNKCPWDLKTARRLILERKIAPRVPGKDFKENFFIHECPICFMFYPGSLNYTVCCKKPICSECFFQVTLPKQEKSCPYCNGEALTITYNPPPDAEIIAVTRQQRSASVGMPRHSNMNLINTHSPTAHVYATQKQQYASVQDRQKIQDDLRSQLKISSQPIRHSLPSRPVVRSADTDTPQASIPPNRAASASISMTETHASANMSQLEELMMMEAIRRSIYDMNMAKESSGAAQHADNSTAGDDDATSNSQEHELEYVYEDEDDDDEYSYEDSTQEDQHEDMRC